jgi:hypothetical protein
MTKLLDQAIAVARRLPPEEQDDIARAVMALSGVDDIQPVSLTAEERKALARSKAAAALAQSAPDAEGRAVWANHGL